MTHVLIQVSNHPEAHLQPATQAASQSWHVVYDGAIESKKLARTVVGRYAKMYRCARCFIGNNTTLGKMHYGVFAP